MKLKNFFLGFVYGVGTLVGRTCKVLSWPGSALSNAMKKLRSVFPSASIQSIVTEEMMHLMSTEGLTEEKLEQRLKIMAETILALQKRLDEMVDGDHISEKDMYKAMDSLKSAKSLTYDERAILVTVFRENIAIQKPDLIGTVIARNSLKE